MLSVSFPTSVIYPRKKNKSKLCCGKTVAMFKYTMGKPKSQAAKCVDSVLHSV